MESRSWRAALMSLVGLALATHAAAQEGAAGDLYSRSGWYVGLGGHAAVEQFDRDGHYRDSEGIDAVVGYRLLPVLALEGQLDWNNDFEDPGAVSGTCLTHTGPVPCITSATVELLTITANARAMLPLGRFQPFALIGGGVLRRAAGGTPSQSEDDVDAGYAARFGAGVDVYLTRRILVSVAAHYVLPTGAVDDVSYITAGGGLQFRF